MPRAFGNAIAEIISAPGTAAFNLGTLAAPGCKLFSTATLADGTPIANNHDVHYSAFATDANGNPNGGREIGIGRFVTGTPNTLTRTAIIESSNGGAAVNFTGNVRLELNNGFAEVIAPFLPNFGAANPTAPDDGLRLFARIRAGFFLPARRDPLGLEIPMWPDAIATSQLRFEGSGTATNGIVYSGAPAGVFTVAGTLTARAPTVTSRSTRAKRTALVSAATGGSGVHAFASNAASARAALGAGDGLGGFLCRFINGRSDAATVANALGFVGLSSSLAAPSNTADPGTLTNVIGLAQRPGVANLQIVYGGSTAQPSIDLGASFPAGTLGGTATEIDDFILFSSPFDNSRVFYYVRRINSGAVAVGELPNTTPGVTLPATGTFMGPRVHAGNNATALAVGLDIVANDVITFELK
jgi:hypothetical protein